MQTLFTYYFSSEGGWLSNPFFENVYNWSVAKEYNSRTIIYTFKPGNNPRIGHIKFRYFYIDGFTVFPGGTRTLEIIDGGITKPLQSDETYISRNLDAVRITEKISFGSVPDADIYCTVLADFYDLAGIKVCIQGNTIALASIPKNISPQSPLKCMTKEGVKSLYLVKPTDQLATRIRVKTDPNNIYTASILGGNNDGILAVAKYQD